MLKRDIPKDNGTRHQRTILILFALSLVFFLILRFFPSEEGKAIREEMLRASRVMEEATAALGECQRGRGLVFDRKCDPNQTGLIGLDFSPLTTSLGSLEAKRTTTNPNFAALVVFLLKEAGVKRGDTIAVGASSSFPALIVALLSASKAMDLNPLLICSLGASQWGANNPDFHWLDMQDCLLEKGIFDFHHIALSLGGERDTGEDMSGEGRSFLQEKIEASGIFFLYEPDLRKNVETRMRLYEGEAAEDSIKAFVNIGGSWSNMGEDSLVLKIKPGVVKTREVPSPKKRGVLFEMAAREIPVIHLLYIKGLVDRYGFIWDPIPLPRPGQDQIFQLIKERDPSFLLLSGVYFFLLLLIMLFRNRLR